MSTRIAQERIGSPAPPHREPASAYRQAEAALWRHYGIQPVERMVELQGLRLRVRVQEAGDGEPVLFVHGGPNAGSTFAPLVAELRGRRCLILDRPGCGLAGPVDHGQMPLPRLAAASLAELLDRLELARIDVVGSSLGGAWAMWFAAAHPDRVRRLVLLGAPAFVPGMLIPGFMRVLRTPVIGNLIAMLPANDRAGKWVFRQMGHSQATVDALPRVYWDWSLRLMADTGTMASDSRYIRRCLTRRGSHPEVEFTPERLRLITAPTLLYWGDADTFGGADLARAAAALIPQCTLQVVAGAGHLPWLDDPRGAARSITTFLDA